ncbi:MAG: FmdE family protein [Thermodesulfobacteriota bacterium]
MICGRTPDQLLAEIEGFHGFVAPGLVIGAFMVDLAQEHIGLKTEADAVVETRHCLPDAVQLLTPCTVGNGWLKIVDLDKFALTLYARHTLAGFRTWLDIDKARRHPNVYNWFMGLVSKKDLPREILIPAILDAGREILSIKQITVRPEFGKREKKGEIAVCPECNEPYAAAQGKTCLACQGRDYYHAGS